MRKFIIICLFLIVSCEKEQPFIDHAGIEHDSLVAIITMGNIPTIIQFECWSTALWVVKDGIYKTPSYDVVLPESQRSIYYRRFTVNARVDAWWEYVGHGIAEDTIYINHQDLLPDTILLSDCI